MALSNIGCENTLALEPLSNLGEPQTGAVTNTATPKTITKEIQMADLDTSYLANQGDTIRFEQQQQASEIIKEGIKGDHEVFAAVRDNRYDLSSRIENSADRIERDISTGNCQAADRFFTVARDTADLRAQVTQAIATANTAAEIGALKSIIASKENTTYLSDKISLDGEKTRGLIQDLKYHDLNRALVERSAELVDERNWGRHWYHNGLQGQSAAQFAQLQSQVSNIGSQVAETRQGMTNFGSMVGTTQASTSNNA